MLARMWSKGNTPLLLVGVQMCTAILEINMADPQKIGNHATSRPLQGMHPKDAPSNYKDTCLRYVHNSFLHNSQKQPRCHLTKEWIRKMWYIYIMEYDSAVKNNGIMKFSGKWMELENIMSEVT